ncbi:MAG TPA: ATP-binding protein [Gemmatimonadaceae bacterium]|nr:ATP-binding protein [Gemmatimonadaceae bacterium]
MKLSLPGARQRRILSLIPVILVLVVGALAYHRSRLVVADVTDVERSHSVLETSAAILTRAIDGETGERAYGLTGDSTFLEPYIGARGDVEGLVRDLRSLVRANPSQRARLDEIDRLIRERFALLDAAIDRRRRGGTSASVESNLLGKQKMDQLRGAIADLQNNERREIGAKRQSEQRSLQFATAVIVLGALAAIALSALLNLAFSRSLAERDAVNQKLKEVNDDLEVQSEQLEMQAVEMESQAAELEATAEDLRSTNDALSRTTKTAEDARDLADRSRAQLEGVLEHLPDAASVYDANWRWTYVNPAAKRDLRTAGVDPDGVIGKTLWEELPQLKGMELERRMRDAAASQTVLENEEYFPAIDAWVETTIVPVGDAVMTFTRDITRRKREAEGAKLLSDASTVLASTLDYEETLEAVARLAVGELADWCTVDLVDDEGGIRQVVVSHIDPDKIKWAKELGRRYPPDYSAATGVGQVIRTGQPEIYPEISEEMLAAGAQDEEHLRITRELQIKSAIVVPMGARGRTLGALTLISSEKGRRYGDDDLTLAVELATRAAIAIDNAQLYRSALAASEAKSAFLATMSHELRTPLNAIIGYQSLLAEGITGEMNESQRLQLSRIRASADHLLGLIDEVLTFSRVEAGKEVVRREETRLLPIVEAAFTMVKPLADTKGLKLRKEGEDAQLYTDPGKVRQILLNLLSNAIKFTDAGEITISTRPSRQTVSISIRDTGIGIARENLERMFDPFWQVEQRSTRKVGGTGLGLSVSRSLARLLGGEISVESELEKGSTFTLTLPLRRGVS